MAIFSILQYSRTFVDKRGSFFSYGETRLAQGRENAKRFLAENPDMALDIENKIRAEFNLPLAQAAQKPAAKKDVTEEAAAG